MANKKFKKLHLACGILVVPAILAGCKSNTATTVNATRSISDCDVTTAIVNSSDEEDYKLAQQFYYSQVVLLTEDCSYKTIEMVWTNYFRFKATNPGAFAKLTGPFNLEMALNYAEQLYEEDVKQAKSIAEEFLVKLNNITTAETFDKKFDEIIDNYKEVDAKVRVKKLLSINGYDGRQVDAVKNFWEKVKSLIKTFDKVSCNEADAFNNLAKELVDKEFDFNPDNQRDAQNLSVLKHWLDLHNSGRSIAYNHPLYFINNEYVKVLERMYSTYSNRLKYNLTFEPRFSEDAKDLVNFNNNRVYLSNDNGTAFLSVKGAVKGGPGGDIKLVDITGDEFKKMCDPDKYASIDIAICAHDPDIGFLFQWYYIKKHNAKTGDWETIIMLGCPQDKWTPYTFQTSDFKDYDGLSISMSYAPRHDSDLEIGAMFSRSK